MRPRPDASRTSRSGSAPPCPLAPSRCSPRTWPRWPPVVPLRPRWQSPWVLLATAAVVLLVLGVVFQGLGGDPRSDDVAPRPDDPTIELPADIGRDWEPDDLAAPARLDLDGDGDARRRSSFLAEPTKDFDGRLPAADDAQQHRGGGLRPRRARAPRSASTPSTRSTPTATATRSWCSTTTTADGGPGRRPPGRPRPARRPAGAGGAGGPRPARPGRRRGARSGDRRTTTWCTIHDVLDRGRARCCPAAR